MSSHKAHNPLQVTQPLYDYILNYSVLDKNEHLRRLRETTDAMGSIAEMQADPIQVNHMSIILQLIGAKRGIEVGIFTGYTTMAMALTIPEDGKILALDIAPEYVNVGIPFWKEAGVDQKIDLVIAPALETLKTRIESEAGTYDFAFIDADKGNYGNYFDLCLELLRPGGVIMVDNVLWKGRVVPSAENVDELTYVIRNFNEKVANDPRVKFSMIPIGDGVTFARKL